MAVFPRHSLFHLDAIHVYDVKFIKGPIPKLKFNAIHNSKQGLNSEYKK